MLRAFIEIFLTILLLVLAFYIGWLAPVFAVIVILFAVGLRIYKFSEKPTFNASLFLWIAILLLNTTLLGLLVSQFGYDLEARTLSRSGIDAASLANSPSEPWLLGGITLGVLLTLAMFLAASYFLGLSTYREQGITDRSATLCAASDLLGIGKGTCVIIDGKPEYSGRQAEELKAVGGPGMLIVRDGYNVISEIKGKKKRVIPPGVTRLESYERVGMVVPLGLQPEKLAVKNLMTRDQVPIEELNLLVFHRVMNKADADKADAAEKAIAAQAAAEKAVAAQAAAEQAAVAAKAAAAKAKVAKAAATKAPAAQAAEKADAAQVTAEKAVVVAQAAAKKAVATAKDAVNKVAVAQAAAEKAAAEKAVAIAQAAAEMLATAQADAQKADAETAAAAAQVRANKVAAAQADVEKVDGGQDDAEKADAEKADAEKPDAEKPDAEKPDAAKGVAEKAPAAAETKSSWERLIKQVNAWIAHHRGAGKPAQPATRPSRFTAYATGIARAQLASRQAGRANQRQNKEAIRFGNDLMLDKIWDPTGGDWRGAVQSISSNSARDVVGRFQLAEICPLSGDKRETLRTDLIDRINQTTHKIGVHVNQVDFGEICIPAEAAQTLLQRQIARWKTDIADSEGETLQNLEGARAKAQGAMLVEIGAGLEHRTPDQLAAMGMLRLIEALEKVGENPGANLVLSAELLRLLEQINLSATNRSA